MDSRDTEESPLVEMCGITKHFPGVLANDHIDFKLLRGEVHALLGENGAGKTTLMNILYGLYRADAGQILVESKEADIRTPSDAVHLGIGMVHQHLKLVTTHTVVENVILGVEGSPFILRSEQVSKRIGELSARYGLKMNPEARIWQLSMGERQRVELLKILYRNSKVLILDEPTGLLASHEIRELFSALRTMASEGRAVVLITHKLNEVMEVSDRVTVLQRGHVVASKVTTETDEQELATLMVGRPVLFRLEKLSVNHGAPALQLKDLVVGGDRGVPAVKNISLEIFEREIFGLAGVAGSGQRELAEAIAGLRKAASGHIIIGGHDFTNQAPREIYEAGVGYVPEDRLGVGSVSSLSVAENLVLRSYRYSPFSSRFLLNRDAIKREADRLISQFSIQTPDEKNLARNLSGGNLQRLILAREISRRPKVLVAEHPTRGLDVGATEYVRKLLLQARGEGAAILLISEDLDELLSISDRVGVVYNGRLTGMVVPSEAQVETIGLMMTGAAASPHSGA